MSFGKLRLQVGRRNVEVTISITSRATCRPRYGPKYLAPSSPIIETIEKYVPEPEEIIEKIRKVRGPSAPQELGLSREDFRDAVLYAKDMRYRYSLLQLIWDIGKEEEYASEVTDYFYSSL